MSVRTSLEECEHLDVEGGREHIEERERRQAIASPHKFAAIPGEGRWVEGKQAAVNGYAANENLLIGQRAY